MQSSRFVARAVCAQMRLRPVFILSEGFCRAHSIPHKRILRPPLFKKSPEVVNYTKLAIRYTSSMTKDMVYGALREIVRGVSLSDHHSTPTTCTYYLSTSSDYRLRGPLLSEVYRRSQQNTTLNRTQSHPRAENPPSTCRTLLHICGVYEKRGYA